MVGYMARARSDHWMPLQSLETALKERSTLVCAAADAHATRHAADKIVFVLMFISRTPAISLPGSTGIYMCAGPLTGNRRRGRCGRLAYLLMRRPPPGAYSLRS